eukprot:jgi/Mesen1/4858/ME000244S04034
MACTCWVATQCPSLVGIHKSLSTGQSKKSEVHHASTTSWQRSLNDQHASLSATVPVRSSNEGLQHKSLGNRLEQGKLISSRREVALGLLLAPAFTLLAPSPDASALEAGEEPDAASAPAPAAASAAEVAGGEGEVVLGLEPYLDSAEGFTLLRPSSWQKVEKAGATLLFEDPEKRSSTIGVVVNPVRIPSLREFGSVDDVAEKLLRAERKKESTRSAVLLRTTKREASGGVPLYTLEYALDSTRGAKRVLTAVTIASRKLYILNIAFSESSGQAAPESLSSGLQRVLDSFDLASS